jgi:hypothetical protein
MTHLLPPGPSIVGPEKQLGYMVNGRKRIPSMKTTTADSTKYLESKTRSILPLKEDTTWTLMLSTPPITLKKRKQS